MKVDWSERGKLPPVSEEMRAWSAALSAELHHWPQVAQKSFFGFTALYYDTTMFGLLPRTCSIFKGNVIAFRFDRMSKSLRTRLESDSRIQAFDKEKTRWFTFELCHDADLHEALEYLACAFDAVRTSKKTK